jgi:hypothetical protein
MFIGGTMKVYDIKLTVGQYLGANSKVMKTKKYNLNKIYLVHLDSDNLLLKPE